MRRILPYAILATILGICLLLAPAAQGAGTYIDKKYGYKIVILPDWTQTPTQPGERTVVGKWKDDRKGSYAELSIFRFLQGSRETPTESPDGEEQPEPRPNPYGSQPDNAEDYLLQMIRRTLPTFELPRPRKLKYGKVPGVYYEFIWEHPRMRGYKQHFKVGIVANGEEEYLIVYSGRSKNQVKMASSSIRSFRFKGGKTPKPKEDKRPRGKATADEDQLIDPEKRARIKAALIGTWKYIDTPHYIIVYNCNRELADAIAKRIEWIRKNAYEKVFPPVEPIREAMVVRICKEMDEYHHYGGPRGSAGYWAAGRDEFVLPDLAAKRLADPKTLGVLHHEGFHQFIFYSLLKHNPPVWFNEGYAEYFYCARPAGKERVAYERKHDMRYGPFKSALGSGKLIHLQDFVKLTHMQYMQQAQLCYPQGWAVSTWLKRVTKNERYRQIPDIYFRELQKGYLEQGDGPGMFGRGGGLNPVEQRAHDLAFEGIDLEELNEDFLKDAKRKM